MGDLTAVQLNSGAWVRTDIIVSMFIDDPISRGYPIKFRCQPNPFAWHPTYEYHPTKEAAQSRLDEIAELVWGRS